MLKQLEPGMTVCEALQKARRMAPHTVAKMNGQPAPASHNTHEEALVFLAKRVPPHGHFKSPGAITATAPQRCARLGEWKVQPCEERDENGRFLTGNSGGGRKLGRRNNLSESFFSDLYSAWQQYGEDAMKRLAADNPKDFVKVAAMVVPKEIDLDVTVTRNLFAEIGDYLEAYRLAKS